MVVHVVYIVSGEDHLDTSARRVCNSRSVVDDSGLYFFVWLSLSERDAYRVINLILEHGADN